ncbi:uncharacterized protein HKW66_Vig0010910 [Vigna angularis]|nr:uncharacterized protein HKW66_Vig0010910 [Vigna angularis]
MALLVFAVIGLASAAEKTDDDYDGDYSIGDISNEASHNGIVAAPLGGPVPPGAFDHAKGGVSTTSATAASSSASSMHFYSVAGVASAALAAAFYF